MFGRVNTCWKRRSRFRLLVSVAAVVGLTTAAGPGAAQPKPVLSFADDSTLTTSCAELLEGVAIVVRNDTAVARPVEVVLGSILDQDGNRGEPESVCGVLTAEITDPRAQEGEPAQIDPGAEAVVTLRGVSEPLAGDDTYTTSLTAYADEGLVARRAVVISEAKPAGVDAVPLIEALSVTHHYGDPSDDWVVWVPVDIASTATPFLENGDPVGVLTGGGGSTVVTYGNEGLKALTPKSSLAPLHIDSVVGAGAYSGSVDLTTEDADETGVVTLSLTVKHWWVICALMLAAGILIGFLVQWLGGNLGTRGRLLQRVSDTSTLRDEARARLQKAAGTVPEPWGAFDVADLETRQETLEEEIGTRTRLRALTIDQKIVDDLGAKIETLEKQIQSLDTIAASAPKVDAAISELARERPSPLPPLRGPDVTRNAALATAATELLSGSRLPAEDLTARAAAITKMAETVRALGEREAALSHYWRLAGELERGLPASDAQAVTDLKDDLEGLRHGLWDAGTRELLTEYDADFGHVRNQIDELWPGLPTLGPPSHVRFARPADRFLLTYAFDSEERISLPADFVVIDAGVPAGLSDAQAAVRLATPVDGPPVPPPPPPPPLTEADADRVIKAARRAQWIVLAISFGVALSSGLAALYVGKSWGTPWDYVAALTWGLVVQATVTTLAGVINGLGAVGALRHGLGRPKRSGV